MRTTGGQVALELGGVDLLDGTPVLDIKPYVAYVDSVPGARSGFALAAPEPKLPVSFSDQARGQLAELGDQGTELADLIRGVLALDPRPAYRSGQTGDRVHGMRLDAYDVRWRVTGEGVEVLALLPA